MVSAAASGPATAATEGSVRPVMASRSGSSLVSTHLPSGRMPTGTTSYRPRSRKASTVPAPMQEIACSGPWPPNTTATLILRSAFSVFLLCHTP